MLKKLFQSARRIITRESPSRSAHSLPIDTQHPFDRATGLDTSGLIHGEDPNSGDPHDRFPAAYYATAPSLAQAMLDRWLETPGRLPVDNYTFIDLGSGKGRVVLIASKLPFRKCIGVEFNPRLNDIAARNFVSWQQSGNAVSPLQAICRNATEFEFPAGPCLAYLFNPFAANVLARLLDRIARSFADRPGLLDLLYVNPENRSLLDHHPGFTPLWQIPIQMSAEDAAADLLHQVDESGNRHYTEELQEPCAAWRFTGT